MELARAFGQAVREQRLALGISQEDLAERAGLDRTYVSGLERGARSNPTLQTQRRLAEALGVPLARLIAQAEASR